MMGMVVTAALTPLFAKADGGSERVDEVMHGWPLEVLAHDGNFYHVRTDYGYSGYINSQHCAPCLQYPLNWVVCGKFGDVVARPDVRAVVVKTLPMGAFVGVAGEVDEIYARVVLADGQQGYIRRAHVKLRGERAKEADLRQHILDTAMSYLGTGYRWGGKSHQGIDCSGLTFMAYRLNGVNIWRDAHYKEGYPIQKIPFYRVKMADLLFFPGHVAMATGNAEEVLHSAHRNNRVIIDKLTKNDNYSDKSLYYGSIFT